MQEWKVGAHQGGDGHQDGPQDDPECTEGARHQVTPAPILALPGATDPGPEERGRSSSAPFHRADFTWAVSVSLNVFVTVFRTKLFAKY